MKGILVRISNQFITLIAKSYSSKRMNKMEFSFSEDVRKVSVSFLSFSERFCKIFWTENLLFENKLYESY